MSEIEALAMGLPEQRVALETYVQNRMSPHDLVAIEELMRQFGRTDLTALEIGSWFGAGSTQVIAKYSATMVCVDHWLGNDNADHRELARRYDIFSHFKKNTEAFGDKIISINGGSAIVCPLLREKTFDFIFIDGDHRYAQTFNDLLHCQRLVAAGGILSGHDCEARLTAENMDYVKSNAAVDSCNSKSSAFAEWHCGVILAVSELVPDAALFADTPVVAGGVAGCSTIWYHRHV